MVKRLLEAGCDLVDETNTPPLHPMHTAVRQARLDVIDAFLKHAERDRSGGAKRRLFTNQDSRGRTVFHLAAFAGQRDVVRKLLHNLDDGMENILSIAAQRGESALGIAVMSRDYELTKRGPGALVRGYDRIIDDLEQYQLPPYPS